MNFKCSSKPAPWAKNTPIANLKPLPPKIKTLTEIQRIQKMLADTDKMGYTPHTDRYLMCNYFLRRGKCNMFNRGRCAYCHDFKKLVPKKCNNPHCMNHKCKFIHSIESKESFMERLGYITNKSNQIINKSFSKQKYNKQPYLMCKYILVSGKCKLNETNNCTFCHDINKLCPRKCRHYNKCRNPKCSFLHRNEDKQQLLKRLGL